MELLVYRKKLWKREKEITAIQQLLHDHLALHTKSRMCFVHGPSGIGKSSLCDHVRNISLKSIEAHFFTLYREVSENFNEYDVIREFYSSLREKGLIFPRYEIACSYLAEVESLVYAVDRPLNGIDTLIDYILTLGKIAAGQIPDITLNFIVNGVLECVSIFKNKLKSTFEKEIKSRQAKKLQSYVEELIRLSNKDIVERLTDYWVEDLNQAIQEINIVMSSELEDSQYFLVIILDAFEKRTIQNISKYDWISQKLFPKLQHTLWIVFSTESQITFKPGMVEDIELKQFDQDSDLNSYLEQCGIQDASARKLIIDKSDGLPAALQILIDIYHKNGNCFDDDTETKGYQQLFSRYFEKHLSPEEQGILKKMAFFPSWNRYIFKYVCRSATIGDCDELFTKISHNTALVSSDISEDGQESWKLYGIVIRSLQTLMREDPMEIANAYRSKYFYERDAVKKLIKEIWNGNTLHFSTIDYQQLSRLAEGAFASACGAYTDKQEFEEYSSWCLEVEQFMTKLGLFELKARLCEIYLESVKKRDEFRFDSEYNEKTRYRFQFTRDLVWAYHKLKEGEKAIRVMGLYQVELLLKYGIHYERIPFSLYLTGLIFQDMGDEDTAIWYLERSIELSEKFGDQDTHPDSSTSPGITARNALGYIYTDLREFCKAQKLFQEAQDKRPSSDRKGQWTGHHNIARMYLRWMQQEAVKDSASLKIDEYWRKAEEHCTSAEKLQKEDVILSPLDQNKARVRKVILQIAKTMQKTVVDGYSPELAREIWKKTNYKDQLVSLYKQLQHLPARETVSALACIYHNQGILFALQGNYQRAMEEFGISLRLKKEYYRMTDQLPVHIREKATIADTKENMKVVKRCMENADEGLNPYEMILQYP